MPYIEDWPMQQLHFERNGNEVTVSTTVLDPQDIKPLLLDWLNSRKSCNGEELARFLDVSFTVPVTDLIDLLTEITTP